MMKSKDELTRDLVLARLWEAVNNPEDDDPRKIVRACEVILKSMAEPSTAVRDAARDMLDALTK